LKKKLSILIALVMAISLCLMPAVPVAAAETIDVPGDYSTIQEAIDNAAEGDTIRVVAGMYEENVVIPPGKDNLQLIGDGSGVTSIEPVSGWAVALGGNLGLIDGIRVEGFTLIADTYAFIALSGTADGTTYTTNLVLEDIVVDGQYGIGLNAVKGVTLTNVHLSNTTSGGGALELTGVSNLTFTNGSIRNNAIGVRLQISPGPWGDYGQNKNIQIHNSYLVGNTIAIKNQDSGTFIDATNNQWDDASGPYHPDTNPDGKGNAVSDYVDYEPWSIPEPVEPVAPALVRSQYAFDVFVRWGYDSTRYYPNDDNQLAGSIEVAGEYNDTRYMLEIPKGCVVTGATGRINWLWLESIDGDVLIFHGGDVTFSEPCILYITDGGRLYQDYWTGDWLGGGEWVEVGSFTAIVDGEAHLD